MEDMDKKSEIRRHEETVAKLLNKESGNSIFLQQLSMEIRTALSGIVAVTEELKTSLAGAKAVMDKLEEIETGSDTLYNIANSIIDYTSLSQEKLTLNPIPFSVKTLMSNLFMKLDNFANRKNIHLFTNVRDVEDVQVNADRARFEQVVRAYIEYAIEHSPSEGNVFIILRYKYLSHNMIKIIIEIETAGTSMYHAMLRDYAFLHQKKYREQRYAGNGIGLYICNNLLEKMDGKVEYNSQNEFESKMRLSFKMEKVSADVKDERKTYSFQNERLMIIDVDHEWSSINDTFFREVGIPFSRSSDFEEAMDMIGEAEDEKNPYCICILKWNAVNMDTMEMIREIRSVFGNEMILMALTPDETVGVEINKVEGLNYVVAQSWIRSLIFDTLIKLKKGELHRNDSAEELANQYNFENRRVLLAEDVLLNAEMVIKMLNNVNISVDRGCEWP